MRRVSGWTVAPAVSLEGEEMVGFQPPFSEGVLPLPPRQGPPRPNPRRDTSQANAPGDLETGRKQTQPTPQETGAPTSGTPAKEIITSQAEGHQVGCGFEDVQGGFAGVPAAGGQAAGLQRVELADNLIGVAPHGTCVHRNELNLVVGVDQERRAVAEAFAVDYANLLQDLVGRVGAQREGDVAQQFVLGTDLRKPRRCQPTRWDR